MIRLKQKGKRIERRGGRRRLKTRRGGRSGPAGRVFVALVVAVRDAVEEVGEERKRRGVRLDAIKHAEQKSVKFII